MSSKGAPPGAPFIERPARAGRFSFALKAFPVSVQAFLGDGEKTVA
jgi:hypothetical protein